MTDQQQPPELFSAERPVQSNFARSEFERMRSYRIRRIVTCVVAVCLIGGGSYSIYLWKRGPVEIPTIKAELPLKQKPEQPGGIDIPNQDVLAYQQIDNSNPTSKPAIEHLLPPPETPQASSPPGPTAAATPAPAPAPQVETLAVPQTPPAPAQEANPAPAPEAAPAATVQKPEAAPVPTPVPEAKSAHATGKKGYRIQLASYPDRELANHELSRFEKHYGSALGPARLHLTKADLGSRGIYYRVQSNPITDNEARDVCAALKKLRTGCIVVKP